MRVARAIDNLEMAYEARDDAIEHAKAAVIRQFAAIIRQRQVEYRDAMARAGNNTDRSNTHAD